MNRNELEKLLGGYATGSLTAQERKELFEAALDDQELFDQLASEEALRQTLGDPAIRARLLAALSSAPMPWSRRLAQWFDRPAGIVATAAAAIAVVSVGVFLSYRWEHRDPLQMARVERPDGVASRPAGRSFTPPEPEPRREARLPAPPRVTVVPNISPPKQIVELGPVAKATAPLAPTGVVGGVPGGVIGGMAGGVPAQVPLPPPAAPTPSAFADNRIATPGAPPAVQAESVPAPTATRSEDTSSTAKTRDQAVEHNARALFNAAPGVAIPPGESAYLGARPSAGLAAEDALRQARAPQRRAKAQTAAQLTQLSAPHLGLRYTVLRRAFDGAFAEVEPATAFERGDQIRLVFLPNDAGYLYVMQRDTSGGWRLLANNRVERRFQFQVTRSGALAYDEPGVKELYVIFSRNPEPEFATLDPRQLEQRLRGSVLVQKADVAPDRGDQGVYIVNTSNLPQTQQVAFAIRLTYR